MDDPARFEHLLGDLSARFAGVPFEQVDKEIDRALELLVEYLGTDRSTFLELQQDGGNIIVTHSWARPGLPRASALMPVTGRFPWYNECLRRGKVLRFDRVPDEFPIDAIAEREYAALLPVFSHLMVPFKVNGNWVCAIGTATARRFRSWTDEDVEHVQIVGQILANAIYRRKLELELRDSLIEVRRLQRRLEEENQYLREAAGNDVTFEQIAGKSPALREMLEQAAHVARTGATVLLLGESGTGKELLARAIHARSKRRERPLIMVNCAALPQSLFESELFGHEKGAFTGATSVKPGRFELADGGTLFVDEIGEIPPEVQVKLLRVLQAGEFERVGGTRTHQVDVRVVAATNRNLVRAIADGHFRKDLYHRLSVFPIHLPPLRERREDIPLLVWDLIHRRQDELERRIERVPDVAMQALIRYSWPGNIRELANVIERALILSTGPDLRLDAFLASSRPRADPSERLDDVERAHFLRVLERCDWRIAGAGNAAEALGMRPSTLRSRLKKLGIHRPVVAPPV